MSKHNDAMAMLHASLATLNSPQPGDAAGLLANALRLLQTQDPNGADPAPDPQAARLRNLVALCRKAIDSEREYELARLARDMHRRNLVVYVDLLETAQ
jgi:hypothetical protein